MQTTLAPQYRDLPDAQAAQSILRSCVHCGFCTATCPTYQVLGDELDSPRGRIYLIKQVLEGEQPSRKTQLHLDRCLTCRNCETTCPSGVDYGHLLDIGRKLVDAQVPRPVAEKAVRWALKTGLTSALFLPALRLGQWLRPWLPAALQAKVPARNLVPISAAPPAVAPRPLGQHTRKVLMLAGCVQPALAPNINSATVRVLNAAGLQTLTAPQAGCCGAVQFHLNDQDGALHAVRRNIDAWWPFVQSGIEAIVINASGCGVMVKDYGHLLQHDALYADKARSVSALTRDVSELLPQISATLQTQIPQLRAHIAQHAPKLVFHPPCTLQHGQKLKGIVEEHLAVLGFDIALARAEAHLCCGSAGTYSVLQPAIATTLRDRKLQHLAAAPTDVIVSANIGCIGHLQSGTSTPVRHWVEVLDAMLAAGPSITVP
jgi:glycolate oxidase iron-sulfur subunit